jgi:VanZ family protein
VSERFAAWAPAAFWAAWIFVMSTDALSAEHTRSLIEPVLRFFYPSLSPESFEVVHAITRKLAHVTEYLVFAVLLDRGFRRDSPIAPARAPLAALVAASLYSLTDEAHQSFVASRTASLYDCGLDSIGAAIGAGAITLLNASRARGG